MIIAFPSGTKDIIEQIILADGRPVDFVQVTVTGCVASGCHLNPVTNTSTNSFCLVCSGLYWIPTYSGISITAHVTWKPSDVTEWESGGQLFTGDCLVKVLYTEDNYEAVQGAKYLVVDNKEMTIRKTTLLGVPSVNRILLETIEKEKEHE